MSSTSQETMSSKVESLMTSSSMSSVLPMDNITLITCNILTSGITGKFDPGDVAWSLTCTALVWLMVPGIGFFYSGMARSLSALSLMYLCCWSIAVVSLQWFLFGYSIALSSNGNFFIGHLDKLLLWDVADAVTDCSPRVPEILSCIFHGMIAGITPALVVGAVAERGRFLPTIVFMFLWSTLVYDVLCCWTWSLNGWSNVMGGLDFAGGTPVHIAAGAAAVAYTMILGERESRHIVDYKPHNIVQVVLGTSLMWFGWFGFNGGSAQGANARSAMVILVTNLSASFGGITWALIDYQRNNTFSALSFCFGAVAGLVTVTPASGFIRPASAMVFGIVGAMSCRLVDLKLIFNIDDGMDIANVHGIGGLVGTILTGIFAEKEIAALDGITRIPGGLVNGHWILIFYQIADCAAGMIWSFGMTYLILYCMNKVPGLQLRVDPQTARNGLDKHQMGECAYERISDRTSP